ncbi:hypothetical protein G7Y89_g12452 [Cudoniella acicularis]|uniref:Uncharacterized protein n=1 Tax=Cudoniella acicularis TaxID=354080 RepID=A0A8H4R949_9HELO|nr:hypothetical protein G7Y89_g12452 [Cudoniella acicularis]
MIGECPKKEKDRLKPTIEERDLVAWYQFALLADRLGFDSEVIRQLKADDPTDGKNTYGGRREGPTTTYKYERNYLFLEYIYTTTDTRGKGITSFYIRRSIYFAFFGRRVPSVTAKEPGGRPPRNPEGNMTGEGDRAPYNAESGLAPP